MLKLICGILALTSVVSGRWLDEYVDTPESVFDWYEVPDQSFLTLMGGRAHVLNVTSLTYLDRSIVEIPDINNSWTHTVVVIVPHKLEFTNVSVAIMNGDCNKEDNKPPNNKDYMVTAADQLAF